MSAHLTDVDCPVCGESVTAPAELHGGYGGDYYNPPEPPEVVYELDEFEYNCDCREKLVENSTSFKEIKTQSNRYQDDMRKILMESIGYINSAEGFNKRYHQITYAVQRLAGAVRPRKPVMENGSYVYITRQPFVEAYDAEIERQAEASGYDYEPDEPYIYED